jgi:CIC family chloride channel protein
MFSGAMLGGAVGFLVPFLDYQICVLVGMGALVSAVVGAPIAIILIVFELTENYQAATAVMIGVVAANAIVTRYYARSIFHRQIRRLGIDLERPQEQRRMAQKNVGEIMSKNFIAVRPDRTVSELSTLVTRGYHGDVFVCDNDQRLLGKLELSALVGAAPETTAEEIAETPELFLLESDSQWSGFVSIENFSGYAVPVVEDAENMHLVGSVNVAEFIAAYRAAVHDAQEEQS